MILKMSTIEIRKAFLADLKLLQNIGIQTFSETFSSSNSKENLDKYLNESFSLKKITSELKKSQSSFYIASFENKPIGYLKLNWGQAQTEQVEDQGLEIHRIYVVKEFHGKKIGQLLLAKALEIAQNKNLNFIWLGVWENNRRALQFYFKNDFEVFDKHLFILGEDQQTDLLLKRNL
jgi:ribosomal protein S18 acetylase RimI-like enzyme